MKKVQYIKQFLFDYAQYTVGDGKKNSALLKINYKENSFAIEAIYHMSWNFRQEIEEVAKGLLEKKHGVNRAAFIKKKS